MLQVTELVASVGLMVLIFSHTLGLHSQEENADRDAAEEYCQYELFQPHCLNNEAILMRSATYGRMHIGRCITVEEVDAHRSVAGDDPRYFGCSADVLALLGRKCSGKTDCEVRVIDMLLEKIRPCFPGLSVYLEVTYDCINVVDEQRSCMVTASTAPIHIISSSETQRICGTNVQPLTVEAPIGQRISVRLIDFSASESSKIIEQNRQPCRSSYGVIVEKGSKQNISICGDGVHRENELYLSDGNALDIIFNLQEEKKGNVEVAAFMLKLGAIGCSDLIPPEDAWLKRSDDSIVIGCYSSRQTWHLHCEGEKWVGVFGNCSEDRDLVAQSEIMLEKWTDKQVLTVVIFAGFTLTTCLTILCTGIICLRRYSAKGKKKLDYNTLICRRNSAEMQRRDQRTLNGSATDVIGNDAKIRHMQQATMHSVFARE